MFTTLDLQNKLSRSKSRVGLVVKLPFKLLEDQRILNPLNSIFVGTLVNAYPDISLSYKDLVRAVTLQNTLRT